MTYLYLVIAIVAEVIATSALKESDGFTKLIPSVIVVLGYGASFYLLGLVLRTVSVGVAYAIWSGLGIVLVSVVAWIIYKQHLDLPAIIGMTLIVTGVIIINLFSRFSVH